MVLSLLEKPGNYIKSLSGVRILTKAEVTFCVVRKNTKGEFLSSREVAVGPDTAVGIDLSNRSPKVATDDLYTFVVGCTCDAIKKGEDETVTLRLHRTKVPSFFEENFVLQKIQ